MDSFNETYETFYVFPSVEIDLPPTMVITEGLPGKYTAVQMHLHWGGWDLEASGAEHTIDGIRYMAEVRGLFPSFIYLHKYSYQARHNAADCSEQM